MAEPPIAQPQFEKELSGQMGKMTLDNGAVSIIGGTSNLIFLGDDAAPSSLGQQQPVKLMDSLAGSASPLISWSSITSDPQLLMHLLQLYFTWHYTYFTTLSRSLFWRDFRLGKAALSARPGTAHCSELLVNAMLALGCHFTTWMAARADPADSATAGDHFFAEAKRLMLENDEHEKPALTTVQALALMSVREAGCGREARGWVYSGMSFRMACDLGLNLDAAVGDLDEAELDARRITIWGCFLFDKCWSNYLGRQPQLPPASVSAPKFDVFPSEDAEVWRPYMDEGTSEAHAQPSRTRAVALQISELCAISSDLISNFYHPTTLQQPVNKQSELDKLSDLHTRLEAWRRQLPKEFEAREGQLPNVLVMQYDFRMLRRPMLMDSMFYHLLFIHLFRPFLKYNKTSSPLPPHVSPRKFLTHSATTISKLLRLYKKTYGFRQVCNIVVYMAHTACTVHLLNLPDKNAARDIVHGFNHLEEIAECWKCARRTLSILALVTKRWEVELPEAATRVLNRNSTRTGSAKSPSATSDRDLPNGTDAVRQSIEVDQWNSPVDLAAWPLSAGIRNNFQTLETSASPPSSLSLPHGAAFDLDSCHASQVNVGQQQYRMQRQEYQWQQQLQQRQEQESRQIKMEQDNSRMSWNVRSNTFTDPSQRPVPQLRVPTSSAASVSFDGQGKGLPDHDWWLQDSNAFRGAWNLGSDPHIGMTSSPTMSSFRDDITGLGSTTAFANPSLIPIPHTGGMGMPLVDESGLINGGANLYTA